MRLKAVLLGTTALTLLGAPVAVQAGEQDWAGFYAGLGVVRLVDGVMYEGNTPYTLENATPVTAEGFVGYNTVMGQLLLGAEVNVLAANFNEVGFPDWHYTGIADLRGKLGLAGDGWSAYALGGFSVGRFDLSGLDGAICGYNFGAGVSFMVTDNLFVGGEFVQRRLTGSTGAKKSISLDSTTRTISAKAGFLFN